MHQQRPETMMRMNGDAPAVSPSETLLILDELKSHQAALAAQNDELRLALSNLSRSLGRYRDLYDLAPVGYLTLGDDVGIQQANLAAGRMLGVPVEALILRKFSDFISIEDQDGFDDLRRLLESTGDSKTCDLRLGRADGTSIWVELTATCSLDGDAGSVMLISMGDITCRRLAEAMLLLKGSALEAAANSIFIINRNGRIEWSNAAFNSLVGHPQGNVIGSRLDELVMSGARDEENCRLLWETILAGRVFHGEINNRRKDGRYYVADLTISPVPGGSGQPSYYIGVCQDISEKKQLQEQILRSRKMEAIGQLACGVAHDFNNVLGMMMMQSEVIEMDEDLSNAARQGLARIRIAASRASGLVKQLLSFGHTPSGCKLDVCVDVAIDELAHMLRRTLGDEVRLDLNLQSSALTISMDVSTLHQLVTNLVINARDAMPSGGAVRIETSEKHISTEEAALLLNVNPGLYLDMRISDNGVGMPPEIMEKIFEPFFTTKDPGKGTGLGLSTVYAIVEQYDGSIQVNSIPGRGTVFRLLFPASKASGETIPDNCRGAGPARGTETILLVEDQPSLRMLTASVLEKQGYQVLSAEHGVEALEVWENHPGPIHLLLTDLMLPEGISGQALAKKLLACDPHLRILFTSGGALERVDDDEALLQARQAFAAKPVSFNDLAETIRYLLDG